MLFTGTQGITVNGFNSGIVLGSSTTEYVFDSSSTATTTISSNLTTSGATITKSGPGTILLGGTGSTANGPVYINQGELGLAFTAGTATLTVGTPWG